MNSLEQGTVTGQATRSCGCPYEWLLHSPDIVCMLVSQQLWSPMGDMVSPLPAHKQPRSPDRGHNLGLGT